LVIERHHANIGQLRRFNHTGFGPSTEIENDVAAAVGIELLPRFQNLYLFWWDHALVNLGGSVLEIVGYEFPALVVGISDGMGCFTLSAFHVVKQYAHGSMR
jgi:hypothetical protein